MRNVGFLAATAVLLVACGDRSGTVEPRATGRHVLLLHLDGYRPDLVRALLETDRLPRLERLVRRGRIAYDATTVDKSETMKVIQSYLTSRLDTQVTGWWQFDRSRFRFKNFWLDPAEVLGYALGLDFPARPTVLDFLSARGENLVAGMSLARRGVPFENYGRAYVEGAAAVSEHTYLRQAHATMDGFLDIHRRIARDGERPPALSTLLLAAADELSHAYGVTTDLDESEHCFERGGDYDETVFRLLEEDDGAAGLESRYFTRVDRAALTGRVETVCVELPELEGRRAEPAYVLSMLVLDMELGRLIETFEALGLYSRTLFIVFGDHGMVDTPRGMGNGTHESFIAYLNHRLGLEDGRRGGGEIGIDDVSLPRRLRQPEVFPEWQSEPVRALTEDADRFATAFLGEIRDVLKRDLHEQYWWLFFLRAMLIDPKVDGALGPVTEKALATFRRLYLRSLPEYVSAETAANRAYFDRYVRLVYGGGARNNAELFLPACEGSGVCSWARRPSYDEIVGYRGGALLEALAESPGVGLIFLRRGNELFQAGAPLPGRLEIEVRDREGNRGVIAVTRGGATGELVFHYRTEPGSAKDPLGYERWGKDGGTYGTYNEWNDRTVRERYVNAVAGMGAYLYSSNPSIGDLVVLHAPGWNFGGNLGGHGGLERGEKTTFMLVSGPGVIPGKLRARSRFSASPDGTITAVDAGRHVPTLLDVTPTALRWLGYSREELDRFAQDGFLSYWDEWDRAQQADILEHLGTMRSLDKAKSKAGLAELSLDRLRPRISRLLEFVGRGRTLERLDSRPSLGNELILDPKE